MMRSGHIKGIIFDLDGVMLDSEVISMRVWQNILEHHNFNLDHEQYAQTIGMASIPAAELLIGITGIAMPVEELLQLHWQELIAAIQNDAEAEPGLTEALDFFADLGLPLAVASNSPSIYVNCVLDALGVRQRFRSVVCADQIKHAKPHPEIYLSAAAAISVDPGHCLAIEDSPIGLQAALMAGMRCIVIPNPHIRSANYEGAYAQYPSMATFFQNISTVVN
jgi:putative hydrolase of the HAD superfamily